ncbi:hypothetical protein HRI97_00110 [Treponema socranskii subsp. buccale]|uniref:hypothetical protein n=1 Tax=Treponema socranskii TaxID=53419 RepID=UPI0020A5A770|nr:hypothetical protein [Treponema socranskii]UTD01572.1 hypothetical protein HRI97_00110 [Treponema socranskii subsp. buccale]
MRKATTERECVRGAGGARDGIQTAELGAETIVYIYDVIVTAVSIFVKKPGRYVAPRFLI